MVSTPFELTGALTSIEDGEDFLETLVNTHNHVTMQQWGQPSGVATRLGMFTVTVGTGRVGMTVIGSIHGEEPAGREACFAFARDLAESTDPTIQAYLEEHSCSILATANPHGSRNGIRQNANGQDINRTYDTVDEPESAAIDDWMLWAVPVLAVDAHEMTTSTMNEQTATGTVSSTGPASLFALGTELAAECAAALTGAGYTHKSYPTPNPVGSLTNDGAPRWKIVTQLMESNRTTIATLTSRVAAQLLVMNTALTHHRLNAADYESAHLAAGGTGGGAFPTATAGRYLVRGGSLVAAAGYVSRGGALIAI